jgi:ABC-type branched-subunit amino acid transport system substrate-binding protein
MGPVRRPSCAVCLVAALATAAGACSDDGSSDRSADIGQDVVADMGGDAEADQSDAPAAITFGNGVTEEACPDAVNPDNGCIYLGQLTDLSGPFALLAEQIVSGMTDFWRTVNESGGIGGFDVDVRTYLRDTAYSAESHVNAYAEIAPNILALAQSLGSHTTLATLSSYEDDDVVALPLSWWSAWEFEAVMLPSGYNYCLEAMNAVDYAVAEHGVESAMAVHFPGDYGEDSAAGVVYAAEARELEWLGALQTLPTGFGPDQSHVIEEILRLEPDLVVLATSPSELAEIVGGAVARGFEGRFIGSYPIWNALLLSTPAGPALEASFELSMPWAPWGAATDAHRAMQAALGEGQVPANEGYALGWIISYPLRSALELAAANRDLTRAGLRQAIAEMTVDYEGALPERRYGGEANETVERGGLIGRVDSSHPSGISVHRDLFIGPTAQAFAFTQPCFDPRETP